MLLVSRNAGTSRQQEGLPHPFQYPPTTPEPPPIGPPLSSDADLPRRYVPADVYTSERNSLERRIDRAESLCSDRASKHVDKDLYSSKIGEIDRHFATQGQRLGDLEKEFSLFRRDTDREFAENERRANRMRLMVITAVIGPTLTALFTVLFVLSGIGTPR